jgi:arylformamidase
MMYKKKITFNIMKIHDISISIKNDMIIYPNNPETKIKKFAEIKDGASSNLTEIKIGSHSGTHLDAPLHTMSLGKSISELPLDGFIGKAYVYDFSFLTAGQGIEIGHFQNVKEPESDEVVLVKTSNSIRGFNEFYNDFVFLSGDCADYLADKNIKLFGIDYLSVKEKGSLDNRAHDSLLLKNIPILEGINLKDISQGFYKFIALPLKIENCDGSPTRAILIEE